MQDFVHLHVHTQYSILDGQSSIQRLVDKALKNGMRGMAVTDHGNMMGIKELYNYVKKKKGVAKDNLKIWTERLGQIEAGTYAPDATKKDKDEKDDAGKTKDELKEKYNKKIAEAKFIVAFKPILGCEMYVAHHHLSDKNGKEDHSGWHLIVLAKNEVGYHHLIKLVSKAWTDGFYMRPRTDHGVSF